MPASGEEPSRDKKGKVLIIAPQPFYEERGTPMNVRLMCTILGKAGYEVDLLVFPTGKKISIPGVRILQVPNLLRTRHVPIGFSGKKLFFDCFLAVGAAWLCLRNRYLLIHGIEEGGVMAVFFSQFRRHCGSVYDMDSLMSAQFGNGGRAKKLLQRIIAAIEGMAMRRASVILTVCQALSEEARAMAPHSRIAQIEDIPLSFAFPQEENRTELVRDKVDALMRSHRLDGCKILLYTGNLQPYQGLDLLLAAWERVVTRPEYDESWRLVIIGGPQQLVDRYTRQLAEHKWQQTVLFLGQRPADEMDCWMERAWCLVSPRSQGDNTPLKMYSYMASGKPIIATRMTTHTQVLSDETAFLVEPEPEEMAAMIVSIFSREQGGLEKGAAARALVRQRYSIEIFSHKLLQAYTLAAAGNKPLQGKHQTGSTEQEKEG